MNSNERLTEHCRSNNPISKRMICEASPLFCHDFKDDCDKCPIGEIINRLSAYEDSGMTPEEIMEFKSTAKIQRCRKATILTKTRVGRKPKRREEFMTVKGLLRNIPYKTDVNVIAIVTPNYSEQVFRGTREKALKSRYANLEVIRQEQLTPEAPTSFRKLNNIYVKVMIK